MRKLIFAFILTFSTITLQAQLFEVPILDKKPANQAEYDVMEPTILRCIDWLNDTPLSIDPSKHIEANAYFMLWLTGTSRVNVVIDGYVLNCAEKNPEILMAFTMGWTKFALEKGETDNYKLALAGMYNIVNRYKNNPNSFKKDKKLRKLVELNDTGQLDNWLKEYFN